jgi:sigma-E factor negative regulatory protein RseC
MIETRVKVVGRHGGGLLVQSAEQSGCGGCGSRSVCGVSGLARHFAGGRKPIAISCGAEVRVGEELQLQMSEGDLLRAGMMAYLLPSVFALLGAGTAAACAAGDGGAVLGAMAGVVVGLLLGRVSGWVPAMRLRAGGRTHSSSQEIHEKVN